MELHLSSQKKFVSSPSLSLSEPIDYTHVSGRVVKGLRVFADETDFNDSTREKGVQNTLSIFNVVLDEEPTNHDTISYLGKIFTVKEWAFSDGMWMIQSINSKRHAITHRK